MLVESLHLILRLEVNLRASLSQSIVHRVTNPVLFAHLVGARRCSPWLPNPRLKVNRNLLGPALVILDHQGLVQSIIHHQLLHLILLHLLLFLHKLGIGEIAL